MSKQPVKHCEFDISGVLFFQIQQHPKEQLHTIHVSGLSILDVSKKYKKSMPLI